MTSALLAGAVFFVGQATPLPRGSEPAADLRGPRHQLMVADGYTAVPLKRTKSGVYWLVPCSYRGKSLQLLLDTGAADTVALDRTAARRAGLRGGAMSGRS